MSDGGSRGERISPSQRFEEVILEIRPLHLAEVELVIPPIHRDPRGFFSETYNREAMSAAGIPTEFVQDNHALSSEPGTLRGLHFQAPPHAQGKLLRVTRGAILTSPSTSGWARPLSGNM